MTVPRLKKASTSSDVPSRKNSRSDANARDASDQINGIFGHVGSRTRSRSTSASAHTMKTALAQHLDEIAIKKEKNAKQEARVMNMSRTEQKQPKVSARVKEMPSITQDDQDSQASLESTSGTQDLAMEDAMGSAEIPGSQLSVRSSSQISQGSYDDGTPEELRGMLGSRPNSDEDNSDEDAPELVGSDDEDEDEDARSAEAAPLLWISASNANGPRVKQIASSVNNVVPAYTSFALTNQCHRGTGTVPDVSSISTGRLRTTTKTGSNRINCATS